MPPYTFEPPAPRTLSLALRLQVAKNCLRFRFLTVASDPMQAEGQGEHILVVDDEQPGRTAVKQFLGSAGYVVDAVEGGHQALAQLEQGQYHLVITDHRMPSMSGTELAAAIKARWPGLPVVLFSACPPRIPIGLVDLVLTKPLDLAILLRLLRQLLSHSHPLSENLIHRLLRKSG